ncbi:MAG: hypothetical protein UMS36scaffold28_60 [Phage 59_13]|nr:MAG: hypothetical protein UMS36scaffold28_60 [Phage 59_13]
MKKKPSIEIRRDRDERGRPQTELIIRDRFGGAAHYITQKERLWLIQELVSELNWRQ